MKVARIAVNSSQIIVKSIQIPTPSVTDEPRSFAMLEASSWIQAYQKIIRPVGIMK
jgi:hypothetical protein